MSALNLSVLDFCSMSDGQSPGERLTETLELAELADNLGYTRYWLSEHHGVPVAHASPELLVPLILSRTHRIRVGPAGILIRFYSPLKVADDFRCIESLYPGRVDLGICRGRTDSATSAALLDGRRIERDTYAQKLIDLTGHLHGLLPEGHPHAGAVVCPGGSTLPMVWGLGSGTLTADAAARLGMAFSLGLFLGVEIEPAAIEILERYRRQFRPGGMLPAPRCTVSVAGICAETSEEAADMLARHVNPFVVPNVVGTPEQCRDQLNALAERYDVDEIVFADLADQPMLRRRSLRLLSAILNLRPQAAPAHHANVGGPCHPTFSQAVHLQAVGT